MESFFLMNRMYSDPTMFSISQKAGFNLLDLNNHTAPENFAL